MYRDLQHNTEQYKDESLPIHKFPDEDSYNYVLQRFDLRPTSGHTCVFPSYGEVCRSTPIIVGERIAQTIFLKGAGARHKAVREGWVDVTEAWKKHIIKVVPRATSPSQQKIIAYLEKQSGWVKKTDVLEGGKVPETQWRTSIKTLLDRELIERKGVGKAAKYRIRLVT